MISSTGRLGRYDDKGMERAILIPCLFLRKEIKMDSNFAGTNLEQWQEVNGNPFEEAEELPFPGVSLEETKVEADAELCGESGLENLETEKADTQESEECEAMEQETGTEEKEDPTDEEREEERKRAEHDASEARRKAEWEARQQEKKEKEERELQRLESMPDEEVMMTSMQRISRDTERLTRRNMKDCVSEYVQTLCLDDADFARLAMHPKKSMVNCFRYINRKAREFVEQEMKDNDIKPENGIYGSDVPDDLCYQWAEEYFRDPDVPEDKPEKEEKFEPTPYRGKSVTGSSRKKASVKKAADKKEAIKKPAEEKKMESKADTEEKESLTGQMSLMDYLMPAGNVTDKAS